MRLGLSSSLTHQTPEEWAERLSALGCRAVNFPVDHTCEASLLDRYERAAQAHDLISQKWVHGATPFPPIRKQDRLPCSAAKSSCALPTDSMHGAASTFPAPKAPDGMDPIGKI